MIAMCYVDRHDEAYQWAKRRRLGPAMNINSDLNKDLLSAFIRVHRRLDHIFAA
jgi:hypothetical protein